MEDMFSLGNVGLWKYVTNSSWALTGEVGELFITKILGTIILKLKSLVSNKNGRVKKLIK